MARKIQIKRGNKSKLPTLSQGELALTLDEQGLWAGGSSGNIPVGGKAITPALIGAATTAQVNSAATAASNAAAAAAAAQATANAAVKKSGDFMTGSLHAAAFGIDGAEAYAGLGVDESRKGARIMSSDNTAQGCALVVSTSQGLRFVDPSGGDHPVYHGGNKPTAADIGAVKKSGDQMTGDLHLVESSLEMSLAPLFGGLTMETWDPCIRLRVVNEDNLNGCSILLYVNKGLYFRDTNGDEHEVIHSGNISRYIG